MIKTHSYTYLALVSCEDQNLALQTLKVEVVVGSETRTSGRTQKEHQETGKGGWERKRRGRMQSGEENTLL